MKRINAWESCIFGSLGCNVSWSQKETRVVCKTITCHRAIWMYSFASRPCNVSENLGKPKMFPRIFDCLCTVSVKAETCFRVLRLQCPTGAQIHPHRLYVEHFQPVSWYNIYISPWHYFHSVLWQVGACVAMILPRVERRLVNNDLTHGGQLSIQTTLACSMFRKPWREKSRRKLQI